MCEILNKYKTQGETDEKSVIHEVAKDEEIDEVADDENRRYSFPEVVCENRRYSFPEVVCEVLNKYKTQVETDEKSVVHEVAKDEEIDEVAKDENRRYSFPEVVCEVLNKHKTQVETDEKSVVREVASDEEIGEISNGEEIDDVASDEEIDEVASDQLGTINESHCGEESCLSLKPHLPSLPTSAIGTPPERFRNTLNSKLL